MSKIETKESMEWKHIDWQNVRKYVEKLQTKIYQASKSGNGRRVRKLQHTLARSYRAKLLSVRKVTQDNRGKRTAGVDGIASIKPSDRLELAQNLKFNGKSAPVKRVTIPKANGKVRNLGIPTMEDRAKQALAKLVLEPEWEAKFMGCNYGFRPGRSAHDAIGDILNIISKNKNKPVFEADISKCFDEIDHQYLLKQINTYSVLNRQIKAWLEAGVQVRFPDRKELQTTDRGTPQGGVISPLLANIALHQLDVDFEQTDMKLVRYADDFVILPTHKTKPQKFYEQLIKMHVEKELKLMGLKLSAEKTRMTRCLKGFDFLGFNVRQYEVGNYRSASNGSQKIGVKTLIKPSKDSVIKHYRKLAEIICAHENAPKETLIAKLNPIIRGWCNYYSHVVSKEIFSKLDHLVYKRLMRMLHRKHPGTGSKEIVIKSFDKIGNRNWAYGNLLEHQKTPIVRHAKVKGDKSPFDGDMKYWGQRLAKYAGLTKKQQILLKQQKGKCAHCNTDFHINEKSLMEIDHIKPKSLGGTNEYSNLQLLHSHCRDAKTAKDGSLKPASTEYPLW